MKRNLVVLQEGHYDCAAAALLSIIKYYGGYLNLESVREIINTTKGGTNAYDLIEGSKEIGFHSYGRKVSFADINKNEKLLPVIAHIKKDNMYHFVVIYKINNDKKEFEIMDPSIGYMRVSFKNFEKNYLGTLLFFSKVKELPKERKDNKLLKLIFTSLLKDKKIIIILSLLTLITFIFGLLDTIYYKVIIDGKITSTNILYKYLLIFTLFIIIKNSFIYLRNKLSIKVNQKIELLINKETLKRLFCLPYCYFKNKSTGEITSRLEDLDSLRELLSNLILNTFVNILLVMISFILMFILNKQLTIVTILILTLYIIIVKLFKNKFSTNIRLIQESKGIYNHNLIESIEALESIRNLNIKDTKLKELYNSYKNTSNLNKNLSFSYNIQHFLKNITYDIGLIILLSIGVTMVQKNLMTIGDLMLLYMIISYFITIIKSLLDKEIDISYTLKNLSKVNNILIEEDNEIITKSKITGSILLKNLQFQYNSNSKTIFVDKLLINEKDKVLITGKSGSGKSTLLKVILKYLPNYKGIIQIGNKELKIINREVLNNSITYIGQNEKLFTNTLKYNITLNRNIKEHEYEKVLKICELDKLRDARKFGDDFLIEESGFNISGGEYQRIVLARALLKDSSYIFIDEALSEVNIDLENRIMKNILNEYRDKTIVYISHKEEVKELFKKIYNMERRVYERN